jgi:dihydrofolate synthase / folylpolyglutamate synthase
VIDFVSNIENKKAQKAVQKTAPKAAQNPATVNDWLAYIEALHPKSIAMGLDRVAEVASRLKLTTNFPIITVAGTNGKGSTCAMLAQIYTQSGYQVGCYTSPHLIRYNERVCINNQAISDDDLCLAFAAVEAARQDIALTYFEMGTLAAMWHFCQQKLDVVILEVGLGGRLDAVNIFEPTCAIVTTVDLDHMEFLGDTREKIGLEKAGVFRANKLAICGEENPPQSLLDYAQKIGANLQLIGRDFTVKKTTKGWQYRNNLAPNQTFDLPKLGLSGEFQISNAACVLTAVFTLREILPALEANIHAACRAVQLIGRFYQLQNSPQIIVDVAHNPHAAQSLAHNLKSTNCAGRTLAVFAMLADKDIEGVARILASQIDAWYVADIHHARGATAQMLVAKLQPFVKTDQMQSFSAVQLALKHACYDAVKNDRIIVFGSFYTVADAIEYLQKKHQSTNI